MDNEKKTKLKNSLFKITVAFMVAMITDIIALRITGKTIFELIFGAIGAGIGLGAGAVIGAIGYSLFGWWW